MKSKCISFFLIGLVGLLFACSSPNNERSDHHQNKATSIEPVEQIDGRRSEVTSVGLIEEEIFTFIGVIEDIHVKSNAALISVEEGEILKSGNSVGGVGLSVASDTTYKVSDKVKVGFDRMIRESHPLGINSIFVEFVE